jgi:hypothetical protein
MHTNLKPDSAIPTLDYQTDDTGGGALYLFAPKGKRHSLENGDGLVLAQGTARWGPRTVRDGKADYDEYIQAHLRQPGSDQEAWPMISLPIETHAHAEGLPRWTPSAAAGSGRGVRAVASSRVNIAAFAFPSSSRSRKP